MPIMDRRLTCPLSIPVALAESGAHGPAAEMAKRPVFVDVAEKLIPMLKPKDRREPAASRVRVPLECQHVAVLAVDQQKKCKHKKPLVETDASAEHACGG